MATERKFTRFAPVDRPMTTREIPEGGFCLSAFLVIGRTGRPSQVLMGHLNPSGPWDHVGALDQERAEVNSKGWMLPSSHLMVGESPVAAAERILKEQLGLPIPLPIRPLLEQVRWALKRYPERNPESWVLQPTLRGPVWRYERWADRHKDIYAVAVLGSPSRPGDRGRKAVPKLHAPPPDDPT